MGTPPRADRERAEGQPYDPYTKEHQDEALSAGGRNATALLAVAVLAILVALIVLL